MDLDLKYAGVFFLISLAAGLRADEVSDYAKKAENLLNLHRNSLNRLIPAADATVRGLFGGGHLYIADAPNPAFADEALWRFGGLACFERLNPKGSVKTGDVVWVSYNAGTYSEVAAKSKAFRAQGAVTVGFGPRPPDSAVFSNWIDSGSAWEDSPPFTVLANALSLWELTAEVTNAAARRGRTLAVLASNVDPQANRHLRPGTVFAVGQTQTAVEDGALAKLCLDGIGHIFDEIRTAESEKIRAVGTLIKAGLKDGRPIGFTTFDLIMQSDEAHQAPGLEYFSSSVPGDAIVGSLGRRPLFLYVGFGPRQQPYAPLPLLRAAGSDIVWTGVGRVNSPTMIRSGDTFIDQHYVPGKVMVQPPGSARPIVPPSGVATLYTFELLRAAAGGFGPSMDLSAARLRLKRRDGESAEEKAADEGANGKTAPSRDPGEIAWEALTMALEGRLEQGLALFTEENFPNEKQPKEVRDAFMELQLQRLLRRTSCAELDSTLKDLDGFDEKVPFTFRGFGNFMGSGRVQYLIAVLEYSCGYQSGAKKRWEKLSKMRPSLSSPDYAYPYLAGIHVNMQRGQVEARRPLQEVKSALGGASDVPRALLLYHQGLLLSALGELKDAAQSFEEGSRAGRGTYAGYLSRNAVPSARTGTPVGITQLAPGVWFREGIPVNEAASTANHESTECNQMLIEMADYAILVDAGSYNGARAALIDFRRVTEKPIRVVFDTHHHGDHTYGNSFWVSMGAKILAYAGVTTELSRYEPRRLKSSGVSALQIKTVQFPTETFDGDTYVIEDATRRVEFRHMGYAHTKGDAIVYLPKERILCTGDVVVNGPYNFTEDADIESWPKSIERMMALDVGTVVPGHGPVGGRELLEGQRDFLIELLQLAHEAAPAPHYSAKVQRWVGTPKRVQEQLSDAIWEVRNQQPRGDADPKSRR